MALQEILESCRETHSVRSPFCILQTICVLYFIVLLLAFACSEIESCCAEMIYLLEQWIFLVFEFHRLHHSIVETRRSFKRKINVTKEPKRETIKVLFERTGNVNDYRAGNVERPRTAVTEPNVEVIEQVIQQWPGFPIAVLDVPLTVSCATALCFHTEFKHANPLMLLPLMNATRLQMLCCIS